MNSEEWKRRSEDLCTDPDCRHARKYHHGVGSAGYCEKCNPSGMVIGLAAIHNFVTDISRGTDGRLYRSVEWPSDSRK